MADRRLQVAVIGSGSCTEGSDEWRAAEEVGRMLADSGAVVVCGGRGGVMDAVASGAAGAGGTVIGVLPSAEADHAGEHCTHVIATGIGHARNLAVVASGQAVIAIGGEWGTLAEIGFARKLGRPVITLGSWAPRGAGQMAEAPGILEVESPGEAVAAALGAGRSAA